MYDEIKGALDKMNGITANIGIAGTHNQRVQRTADAAR
jgi:hypothetical protein